MKAIATTDFGAPVTLVEIPAPEPAEGEILVRVASSSINGFDLSVASGRLKGMMEHRFPVVLGKDFAGTVESTGAGVDDFAEGDSVFGVLMKAELGDGCFGERVACLATFAARVPDGVEAVLHFAGDGAALAALLSPSGRMASTLGLAPEQIGRDDVTLAPIMANPVTATLAQLADAAAAGIIRVPVTGTYRLEDVPQGL